ncbi:hypothetical protein HMPREF3198_01049 [Winkia neuii]|nr:hypothetical protein HMPREF3198_01049 [Winkia neuii]
MRSRPCASRIWPPAHLGKQGALLPLRFAQMSYPLSLVNGVRSRPCASRKCPSAPRAHPIHQALDQ